MMTDFMAAGKRQTSTTVADKRRALTLINPFVSQFDGWNQRAAKASATALSHMSSPTEKAEQALLLARLYDEVDIAYKEFETAVAGEIQHGRIDDLRAAFMRLRSVLEHWRTFE